jgi:hypothetical protein
MKPSRKLTVIGLVLLIACLAGSTATLRQVDELRTTATLEEVLYISSPKVLKRLSLGYEGLLADIYWTRAVQYFGAKHHVYARQYNLLAPLLEITTYLDPHLVVAYEFGANYLSPAPPDGAGMPERAVKLVEHGIENNPDEWKLYYEDGFIYYLELHDYKRAEDAFERGSRRPGAHPFLKIMAARMAQNAGQIETSRMLWITTLESTEDKMIKENAVTHLRALQVDQDVTDLETGLQQYRTKTGHAAQNLRDLVTAGIMPTLPLDPTGSPYRLTADGRIEVRRPDNIPFITKGTPPGYKAPVAPLAKRESDAQ